MFYAICSTFFCDTQKKRGGGGGESAFEGLCHMVNQAYRRGKICDRRRRELLGGSGGMLPRKF